MIYCITSCTTTLLLYVIVQNQERKYIHIETEQVIQIVHRKFLKFSIRTLIQATSQPDI
jgi:hypothetical protein